MSTTAIYTAVLATLYLYGFWLVYILVMGLYRAYLDGRLKGLVFVLAMPPVAIGYLMDWLANFTFASLWFLQLPETKGELVTDRLSRYLNDSKPSWRKAHAQWICHTLLDAFDPSGDHCNSKGDPK